MCLFSTVLNSQPSLAAVFQRFDEEGFPIDELPMEPGWFMDAVGIGSYVFWFVTTAFWIWMIVECLRKDPDRYFWMFVIVFLHTIGAAIYFFLRWLPSNQIRLPKSLGNMARGKELRRLEIATQQIGNAHQFVQYGDALRETRQQEKGIAAYREAIAKEPDNLPAQWGLSQLLAQTGEFDQAVPILQQILKQDPQYKFGDVSLALGRALCESKQTDAALEHLREHVVRWRHPEGVYRLAVAEVEAGNTEAAERQLVELIMDVDGSPKNIARKHGMWKSLARKLLKRL